MCLFSFHSISTCFERDMVFRTLHVFDGNTISRLRSSGQVRKIVIFCDKNIDEDDLVALFCQVSILCERR